MLTVVDAASLEEWLKQTVEIYQPERVGVRFLSINWTLTRSG